MKFKNGDLVCKPKGYSFPGVIVSAFETTAGKDRYVVESISEGTAGMLHIFSAEVLELSPESVEKPVDS